MLKNGKYVAWFKTPSKQGTGVIHLLDGSITGGDSILSYSGTYQAPGDEFTAILKTTRDTKGHETIFGADNLTLRLKGKAVGRIARFIGAADEFPDTSFEGTLILARRNNRSQIERCPVSIPGNYQTYLNRVEQYRGTMSAASERTWTILRGLPKLTHKWGLAGGVCDSRFHS